MPRLWTKLRLYHRDEHVETWWAIEVGVGPHGLTKAERLAIAAAPDAVTAAAA